MYLLPGGSRRCIASCKMHEPGNAAGASWCDLRHPRTDDWNLLAGDFVRKQTVTTTCFLVPSILFYLLSFADFLCTKYETSWYPSMIAHFCSLSIFITMPLHYVWWRLAMWVDIPGNVHVWLVISIQGCTNHKNRKKRKWMILGGSVAK